MNGNKQLILKIISAVIIILIVFAAYLIYNNARKSDIAQEPDKADESNDKNADEIDYAGNSFKEVGLISESDYVDGDLNAPVKIIVYSDFACPFCLLFTDTLKKVKENFDNNVVIAYRHFSLLIDANSYPAALASECAGEEGKFWEMHDKLFNNNSEEKMGMEQFKKDAEELGLNLEKFNNCIDTEKYKEKIESQIKEAGTFGVIGTPTIFVNGRLLAGAYPFEDFRDSAGLDRQGMKSIIEEILK